MGRIGGDRSMDESRARALLPGRIIRPGHTLLASSTTAFSCPRSVGPPAVSSSGSVEPPDAVRISLDEALELLAALEDSRDVLIGTDHLSVPAQVVHQIRPLRSWIGRDCHRSLTEPGCRDGSVGWDARRSIIGASSDCWEGAAGRHVCPFSDTNEPPGDCRGVRSCLRSESIRDDDRHNRRNQAWYTEIPPPDDNAPLT